MGISINLYGVSKAEKFSELRNPEKEINDPVHKKVDLYKMTQDLAVIFLNKPDPFEDINTIPYKMLFGNFIMETAGDRQVCGFLPTSEISPIVNWINSNKLHNQQGFFDMYNTLSAEVKKELEDIGSPGKEELYNFYVKPLVNFYLSAQKESNSVIITGE